MSTNTYFRHYAIHYVAKTLKIYDMWYRLQQWCFFVHKSLKRDNKKENDEIKKMWNNKKELKVNLWDIAVYLKLLFLNNSSQKCVYIMSCISEFSFPLVNYFIFKDFQRRVRVFEKERSWNKKFSFQ